MSDRTNGSRRAGAPSLSEACAQSRRAARDVTLLGAATGRALQSWDALLRERLRRQPYATLAVAAGIGYVLGGGVPPVLVRSALGVGGRIALERLLGQLVRGAAEAAPS